MFRVRWSVKVISPWNIFCYILWEIVVVVAAAVAVVVVPMPLLWFMAFSTVQCTPGYVIGRRKRSKCELEQG